MNTRKNAKRVSTSLNHSRGRGHISAASSPGRISGTPSFPSDRPLVAHSPPGNIPGQVGPSTSAASASFIPNLVGFNEFIATNKISEPLHRSSRSDLSLDTNPDPIPNMAQFQKQATFETENDIFHRIQEMIRNSQAELRTELTAIKEQVSNTRPNARAQLINAVPNDSNPSGSSNSISRKLDLEKCKVTYDGTSSVSDFLFKVETWCRRTQCSNDYLLSNFQVLLTGKAERWYWAFIRQEQNVTYPMLKYYITKEFGTLESDHEILMRLSNRRQSPKESFDDFYSAVLEMNARTKQPINDKTLISILKRNVNQNLKLLLFNADSKSVHDLRDHARSAEQVLREGKVLLPQGVFHASDLKP